MNYNSDIIYILYSYINCNRTVYQINICVYLALFIAFNTTQWQAVADEASIEFSESSSGDMTN
jgi:hypothetical protein